MVNVASWLDAAFYYGENFDEVKEVIDTFNPNYAKSIQNAQQLFSDITRSKMNFR